MYIGKFFFPFMAAGKKKGDREKEKITLNTGKNS